MFSFGSFTVPDQSGSAVRESENGSRYLTGPWGDALKALGNAALDACLQAVVNRLTDEKINNWSAAFKSVSYMGAAWEGISSILPWKISKTASYLITALSKGFIVVIGNSKSNSSYTAEEGLRDFISAMGESVLGQIIGERLSKKIPEAISGLVRFVGYSTGTVAKIGAKCFTTQLMNYGCFTGNTPVYTSLNSQKLIRDIALHDIVLSHGTINKYNSADVAFPPIDFKNTPKLNAVSFISENGVHSCQLALNDASLVEYDINDTGDHALLSIPEQGIEGIYIVSDIRKINPPKIPIDEDSVDDFVFSPVTAIFAHTSDDVWKLTFDNGEKVEVTSMHPFMDAVSGLWKPVAWLNGGDVVKTKTGIAVLTTKEKLEGTHTVYNFEVDNTHNYLVGDAGFLVHNTCGDLDKLATNFVKNLNSSLKKQEIAEWWSRAWPQNGDYLFSIFGRGMFFEKLLLKAPILNGFKATTHSFPLYDFYTTTGAKIAASMKTTRFTDLNKWLNYVDQNGNKKMLNHLNDLNAGLKKSLDGVTVGGAGFKVQMIIVMPRFSNFQATRTAWLTSLQNQFKNIEFKIINVEDQFNL